MARIIYCGLSFRVKVDSEKGTNEDTGSKAVMMKYKVKGLEVSQFDIFKDVKDRDGSEEEREKTEEEEEEEKSLKMEGMMIQSLLNL